MSESDLLQTILKTGDEVWENIMTVDDSAIGEQLTEFAVKLVECSF